MIKASAFAATAAVMLISCSALTGAKAPMTEEQFAEVKENCQLSDARFGGSGYSESSTDAYGVETTVSYEDENADAVSIFLTRKRSDGDMAQVILCLNEEFDRLGAEAKISLPDGQF